AQPSGAPLEGRLSRLLEEPEFASTRPSPTPVSIEGEGEEMEEAPLPMPSILAEDEDEIFKPASDASSFDAEEDLDIPDFLKS
ncbi:MAG TPA: hypothetical protein VFK59_12745, partial [Actinomycetota bacterium]|nr:hypothetical protein [Actinomycetota bacterium]